MTAIIEMPYQYQEERDTWAPFYEELEKNIIIELGKHNLDPKQVLYRGIKYSNLQRLINTGCDLPTKYPFYAASIGDGHHEIRIALELAKTKGSTSWFFEKKRHWFVISIYDKNAFNKNTFVEADTYKNYTWNLKEGLDYKNALKLIFLFKPK